MATITVTASAAAQPRVPTSTELVYVEQTYSRSVSASAGDVFWFENCKIPNQALITRIAVDTKTSDGATIYQLGLGGGIVSGALFGSLTASAVATLDNFLEAAGSTSYRVSVSDDAAIRYVVPTLTQDGAVGASPTGTVTILVRVWFTMIRT